MNPFYRVIFFSINFMYYILIFNMLADMVTFIKKFSQVDFTGTNNATACISSLSADGKLTFLLSILHSLCVCSKVALGTGTKISA